MKRPATDRKTTKRLPPAVARMAPMLLWSAVIVGFGLAHIHLRLLTRDFQMQSARYQAEWEDLYNRHNTLKTEVSRLRDGNLLLSYAQTELDLVKVAADEIQYIAMPREMVSGYDRVYSELALARRGALDFAEREPLVARLLGTIPWPDAKAQAEPADLEP